MNSSPPYSTTIKDKKESKDDDDDHDDDTLEDVTDQETIKFSSVEYQQFQTPTRLITSLMVKLVM